MFSILFDVFLFLISLSILVSILISGAVLIFLIKMGREELRERRKFWEREDED